MKSIFITGWNGFVGKHILNSYKKNYKFTLYDRNIELALSQDIILHFAGLAHDTNNDTLPEEFYISNTDFTKKVFDNFLNTEAKVFITLSSVKAVADSFEGVLSEEVTPNPITHYGKSKLLAENYIRSNFIPDGKRFYVLRPCMVHGPFNKGNLNLLYGVVSRGLPWPLGSFKNSRSYLSIENLCFIIQELIEREDIPSGVYNVADDVPLSTNEVIEMIAESKGKKAKILYLSTRWLKILARIGDFLSLPLNSERLKKLTESYVVSNDKIRKAIGKPFPVSSKDGFLRTFKSFADNS